VNHEMAPERRHALRQKVNTPAFASFDGVTGGMILDLSEEGLAMQAQSPLESHSLVPLHLSQPIARPLATSLGPMLWAAPECAFPICPTKPAPGYANG